MLAGHGGLWKNADPKTNRNGSQDAGEVWTCVGDVPRAPGGFQGVDGAIAIKTALRKDREWNGVALDIDRVASAGDPVETLGPGRDRAGVTEVAFEEREIEFTAFDVAAQTDAEIAAHVEPQTGARAREIRQHLG